MRKKYKINYRINNIEIPSQISFFGYDNLSFKTVNLPKPQKFVNLCRIFHIKKIITNNSIFINYIKI